MESRERALEELEFMEGSGVGFGFREMRGIGHPCGKNGIR